MSALTFLNPWILAGLIFLPALWYLLRVTPPSPRLVKFPAARFLAGLIADEQTVRHTPWWVLLLRILCAALILVALARPLLNPATALPGHGAIRIVMDNGWAAAQNWNDEKEKAASLIDRANREGRALYILTTAPEPDGGKPVQYGPLAGKGAATTILNGLKPYPWPADYDAAGKVADAGAEKAGHVRIVSFWLCTGLQDNDAGLFARLLDGQGELHLVRPNGAHLPLLLRPAKTSGPELRAVISAAPGTPANVPVTIQALAADGRVLDSQRVITSSDPSLEVTFPLPEILRNQVTQIRLLGRQGAGAVLLLDDLFRRRTVGLAVPGGQDNSAPLIEASFYLTHALETYADVVSGPVKTLLEKKPPAIIMPDTGALPADELEALEKWVRAGGLLLRFAGPNMTQGQNFLTPVPLRTGGRAMSGALTWDKPEHIAPFPVNSPYNGLSIPADITVNRQLLAEPVEGLDKMTWANLSDGTPLITARSLDRGLLVLIHTTATPQWSSLALSGLFVQLLQRTINLAGQSVNTVTTAAGTLQPLLVLDGFGNASQPGGLVQPIAAADAESIIPSPAHPPGLYGRAGVQTTLNLGAHLPGLRLIEGLPSGTDQVSYTERSNEKELLPGLLTAAFVVFMIDWLVMIVLQAGWRLPLRRKARTLGCLAALFLFIAAPAQAADEAGKLADDLHLAYIRTGNSSIDFQTYNGMTALTNVLTQRTSVEPATPVAVDPAHDELVYFPLIYWPVVPGQPPLTPEAVRNVQNYLDHGGTIFFDTRDQAAATPQAQDLKNLTAGLNIPPLVAMPGDHVVTKSFYLLKDFPARYDEGTIWIEENSASGRDGVSSVIIGNHDWAASWAAIGQNQENEMALRFGVNIVMYALTGNYKNDQVHMPQILERMGR